MKDESGVFKRPAAREVLPEVTDNRCACCGRAMIAFLSPECLSCERIHKATARKVQAA